jgi:hypothetical protein
MAHSATSPLFHHPTYDHAIADPRAAFSHPQDILHAEGLSEQQKLKLLTRWEENEKALIRAAGEGMGGGEQPSLLQDVEEAIQAISGGGEQSHDQ